MQIELDSDANHRALRRCYRCGSYARPFDEINGAIRCEPCARREQARKRSEIRADGEEENADPTVVSFIV